MERERERERARREGRESCFVYFVSMLFFHLTRFLLFFRRSLSLSLSLSLLSETLLSQPEETMASGSMGDFTVDRRCRELSILGFGGLAGPIGKYERVDGLKSSIKRMLDLAEDIHFSKEEIEEQEDKDVEMRKEESDESDEQKSDRTTFATATEQGTSSSTSSSGATPFQQRNGGRWIKTRIVEAIAHTMLHVPSGTPMRQIVERLTSLCRELALTYHEMNSYARSDVRRSLGQILVGCSSRHVNILREMLDALIDPLLVQTTTQTVHDASKGGGEGVPRYHPTTGLLETRLAFEYVSLWSSLTRTSDVLRAASAGHMVIPEKEEEGNEEGEDEDEVDILDHQVNLQKRTLQHNADVTASLVVRVFCVVIPLLLLLHLVLYHFFLICVVVQIAKFADGIRIFFFLLLFLPSLFRSLALFLKK